MLQAYQLAEDLGRAFADKLILLTSIEAEASVPAGPLKVKDSLCTFLIDSLLPLASGKHRFYTTHDVAVVIIDYLEALQEVSKLQNLLAR